MLAHELGHFRLRHVVKRMAWIFVGEPRLPVAARLRSCTRTWFYAGLNVEAPLDGHGAGAVLPRACRASRSCCSRCSSRYSRKHEFEADEYAAQHASAGDLVSALVKLYKDNASTLTPDPLHSAFYDSHPPALVRIARLQEARQGA